jgi:hypothetical protein
VPPSTTFDETPQFDVGDRVVTDARVGSLLHGAARGGRGLVIARTADRLIASGSTPTTRASGGSRTCTRPRSGSISQEPGTDPACQCHGRPRPGWHGRSRPGTSGHPPTHRRPGAWKDGSTTHMSALTNTGTAACRSAA